EAGPQPRDGLRRALQAALSRPVASFQVASIAQASATAPISPMAPARPTDAGGNTAAPRFLRRPVWVAARRPSEAPSAKHETATQSFTCPSPARQSEPAPQPPASVIPMPKASPPASAQTPPARKTPPLLSLWSVAFK